MLTSLRIQDFALITDMSLEFSSGMNVLTGETGAGKSFILKGLGFVLGERVGAGMVRSDKERAVVEAQFMLDDGAPLILRRELLAASGRSRFFLNGKACSQDTVKELRPKLVMHTSQHGQQRLLQPAFQSALVDTWMQQPALLDERDALYKGLKDAEARRLALQERWQRLADRRDLLELQLKQIEKVNPQAGEEEELEVLRTALRGSEQLRRNYERAQQVLRGGELGLLEYLGQLERALEALAADDEEMVSDREATTAFRQTVLELERRLRRPPLPNVDADPEYIESRLFQLAQLKRKLHRTIPEILELRQEIEDNLSFLDACTLDIRQIEKEEDAIRTALKALLERLNPQRIEAAKSFTNALESELQGLGFSEHVRVLPDTIEHELFPECLEQRVRLLWAPNPGQTPQSLDRIASGGELSRFMLAVVSMQAAHEQATLIFDEVDAGVGGTTLNKVAERLEHLASTRQMIIITHWPQIASRGTRHFQVFKEIEAGETFTRCHQLESTKQELARMAGIV